MHRFVIISQHIALRHITMPIYQYITLSFLPTKLPPKNAHIHILNKSWCHKHCIIIRNPSSPKMHTKINEDTSFVLFNVQYLLSFILIFILLYLFGLLRGHLTFELIIIIWHQITFFIMNKIQWNRKRIVSCYIAFLIMFVYLRSLVLLRFQVF